MKKAEALIDLSPDYLHVLEENGVIVDIPSRNDKHMKWIKSHDMLVQGKKQRIEGHYRRGDIVDGMFVTKNFYISPSLLGKRIIGKCVVFSRINYFKGEISLVLDIYPDTEDSPRFKLKIGTPHGGDGAIEIPQTNKFVKFEKIK